MGNRVYRGVVLMGVVFGFCGCVTQALWENEAFDGLNRPAAHPNVQVARYEGDWLVRYDEVNEKSSRVRRRAYVLLVNDEKVRGRKRPDFVTGAVAIGAEGRAEISTNAPEFTLYDGDAVVGTFGLPNVSRAFGPGEADRADATDGGGGLDALERVHCRIRVAAFGVRMRALINEKTNAVQHGAH
ncbi:MAG TPA: hypothetical protein VJ063_11870 [Verrucomicrobiae bacterium]|nr:hypothetical protein [Verrucomicrobiae bacterium]